MINKIRTTIRIIRLFQNWPTFFACYFGWIKNKNLVLKFRNGLVWHVDTTKRGFAVLGDVWIQNPYKIINKIKNPKVILDLGAHIGSFSIMAAKKFPHARIYSIDASIDNFEMLKKNLKENNIKNVFPFNEGAGSENTELEFYIDENNTVLNSFKKRPGNKSYKIKCKTLKKIFHELKIEKCDFMKLDVEGFEYKILKKAEQDGVLKKITALAAEINPSTKEFELTKKLLVENGFEVNTWKDIISATKV